MENIKANFIKEFKLPRDGFSEPVVFKNEFGFSTSKISKKEKGFISLYKFYISDNLLKSTNKLKPITVSVSYGEKTEDGSVLLSSSVKKLRKFINSPVDLISTDEYYYDVEQNKFYFKEKELNAVELLKRIENLHLKPTMLFVGLPFRLKLLFFRIITPAIIYYFYTFFVETLHLISGTKTSKNIYSVIISIDKTDNKQELYKKESFANEKINIFGYHASAWSVVVYAVIHFSLYTIWYYYWRDSNFGFFKTLLKNSFLTITYVIPTLVLFERVVPDWLQSCIVYTGKLYNKVSFRKIKI